MLQIWNCVLYDNHVCSKLEYVYDDEMLIKIMTKTLKTKWEVDVYYDHPINAQMKQIESTDQVIVVVEVSSRRN